MNKMTNAFFPAVLILLASVSAGRCGQPISLEMAIREVCANSDSLKRMRESVKKSEEMVREKWSNALPVIAASATAAVNHGSAFGGSSSSGSTSRSMGKIAVGDSSRSPTLSDTVKNLANGLNSIQAALSPLKDIAKAPP
jgi:hypothetical protein